MTSCYNYFFSLFNFQVVRIHAEERELKLNLTFVLVCLPSLNTYCTTMSTGVENMQLARAWQ